MKTKLTINKCSGIRQWLYRAVLNSVSFDAAWIQSHVVHCPRCQRRLAAAGRLDIAFSLIKSQPHNLDLLMRANQQAIGVLKHSLRFSAKAEKLKYVLPEPKTIERCMKYRSSVANAAACFAILFLMKTGIFSSMEKFHSKGQQTIEQYYANRVGQDISNDIFSS